MNTTMKKLMLAGTALVALTFVSADAHAVEMSDGTHGPITSSVAGGLQETTGASTAIIDSNTGAVAIGANATPSVAVSTAGGAVILNVTTTGTANGVTFADNITTATGSVTINATNDNVTFSGDTSTGTTINAGSASADPTITVTVNTAFPENIVFAGAINAVDAADTVNLTILNGAGTAQHVDFTGMIGGGSNATRIDNVQIGAADANNTDVRFSNSLNAQGNITLGAVGGTNTNLVTFGLNGQTRGYTGTVVGAEAGDTNNIVIASGSNTSFNSAFGAHLDNILVGGSGITTVNFNGGIDAVSGAFTLGGTTNAVTNNVTFSASGNNVLTVNPVVAGAHADAINNITIAGGADQIVRMVGGGTNIDTYTINTGTTLEYQAAAINNVLGAGGILTLNRAGDQAVTADIGTSGDRLATVNLLGSGIKTLNAATYAGTTNIGGVTVNASGSINGNIAFTDNGTLNFAHNAGTTGSVTAATQNHGTVKFAGSAAVDGAVGAVNNEVHTISIDGDNTRTVSFNGAVNANTMAFTSSGVATLASGVNNIATVTKSGADVARLTISGTSLTVGNITTNAGGLDLNFGTDSTLNLGSNQTVHSVLNNTAGHGTLNYTGGLNITDSLSRLKSLTVTSPLVVGTSAVAADNMNVGINTVTVGTTFTTTANTLLTYRVNTPTTSGKITSTGEATVVAGTKVNMVVDTNVYVAQGQEFILIDGAESGGHVDTLADGNLTTTNTALLHFKQRTTDKNNLVVYADRTQMNVAAKDPNAAAVGTMLDKLGGSGNPDINDLQVRLGKEMTAQGVEDILKKLHPDPTGASISSISSVGTTTSTVTSGRLDTVRAGDTNSGVSSGDGDLGQHVWMQAFGASADQSRRDGVAGYDADSYGFIAGIDTDVTDSLLLGIALSYADTDADSHDANRTDTTMDSYQVSVYADQDLGDEFFLTGQLSYMYSDIETVRHNVGGIVGNTARADFGADQYSARAELGRPIDVGSGISLTPSGLVNYSYIDVEDYTERGAGGLSLRNVDTDEMQILEFGLNLKAEASLNDGAGGSLKPNVHGGIRHDVIGDDVATTGSLAGGGAAFKTEGFDAAQTTGNIGAGLKWETADGFDFSANYDYEYKSDYDAHSGYVRAGYKF